jgi:hypothetical protein
LALCFHSILFFGLFFNFYIQVTTTTFNWLISN